jgi:hypothetical protein
MRKSSIIAAVCIIAIPVVATAILLLVQAVK